MNQCVSDSQTFLLRELAKANLSGLLLPQEGEDVFEIDMNCLAAAEPTMEVDKCPIEKTRKEEASMAKRRHHPPLDASIGNSNDIAEECGKRRYYDIDCEDTIEEKIEKIMNRIVVRRQRAYLTGLLTERTKARTTSLISKYEAHGGH